MKITIKATVSENIFPADYTRPVMSLIKHTYEKSSNEMYNSSYGKNTQKNYCFAVRFNNPVFKGRQIILDDREITIYISTDDIAYSIDIYNAFLGMRRKLYPMPDGNTITVQKVLLHNHKEIEKNDVLVKMVSPLLVKKHEGRKDYFYSWDSEEFIPTLENSIRVTASELSGKDMSDRRIEVIPYAPKKTVVYCFGMKVTANVGIYRLSGDLDVLNLIYQTGMGSKRSAGFGMFEIL